MPNELNAAPPALPAWFETFLANVCEIPDRNSPDGEPEAIVATLVELRNCAQNAIEEHTNAGDLDDIVALLRAIRPEYGAPGSRDVDVTAQRERIDHALSILTGRVGYVDKAKLLADLDGTAENVVALNSRLAGAAGLLAGHGHKESAEAVLMAKDYVEELELSAHTLDKMRQLLDGVALALKGQPEPLTLHGWHDLPKLAADLMHEATEYRKGASGGFLTLRYDLSAKAMEGELTAHLIKLGWTPPSGQKAPFMLVAMDDEGNAHVEHCSDEAAVEAALGKRFYTDGPTDEDERQNVRENAESLLENGSIHFEGDPAIYLYRLA